MSISDTTENAILNLIFNATTWTDYAISAGSGTPETNIVVTLQIADPLDAGVQNTSEITYSSYARVNRTRSNASGGWTSSSAGSTSPHTTNIDFPASTAGTGGTASHFTTGKSGGGASAILWSGTVSPSIVVGTGGGVTPRLTTGSTITLD